MRNLINIIESNISPKSINTKNINKVVDIIRKLVPEAVEIWFHGSRANGTAKRDSDWDFYVVLSEDTPKEVWYSYRKAGAAIDKLRPTIDIQVGFERQEYNGSVGYWARREGKKLWSADQMLPDNTIIESAGVQWSPELNDSYEIADYLESISASPLNWDDMVNNWKGCRAVLKRIPINEIKPTYADIHAHFPERDEAYANMDPNTMPPLIIDKGIIEDGYHRYRAALKMGLKELLCYVIVENPEDEDAYEKEDEDDDLFFNNRL